MAGVPIFSIKTVAPYARGALDLAQSCQEHAQEIFAIFDPASPAPRERVLKDDCEGEKFDSATMIFRRQWHAEWTSGAAVLRAEALEDEFCDPVKIVLKITLENGSASFQLDGSDVIGIVYSSRGSVHYVLDMKQAKIVSANLSAEQLVRLGELLHFPPASADKPFA